MTDINKQNREGIEKFIKSHVGVSCFRTVEGMCHSDAYDEFSLHAYDDGISNGPQPHRRPNP